MKYFFILLFLYSGLARSATYKRIAQKKIFKLALEQSTGNFSGYWDPSQRDCSGFVRFLFRTGAFTDKDSWLNAKGENVSYVSADQLIGYNFFELGRNTEKLSLETGDVFVWYMKNNPPKSAWHLMVYLKPPEGQAKRDLLIYHNGEMGQSGAVRKVWLHELKSYVAGAWAPNLSNRTFMGVYRWKGFLNE